ncbi:DUF2480 family protein [Flavihumibacter petaseus]|uniref:DUF2480 family protein n=1 Tax=Flavihumibacter petaseus NBRC 106054 TaxID=1220578 RepID=A0A0E9MYS5_9BACT|nr:DUF2480 family protein [Flavihumibacter petaseus]GAO42265.1 hypothetical protein FPE01S_01_12780 [Flavihumibacter petaseus NBRC 106054]
MADILVNKVAESGLITLDLEAYLPVGNIVTFDLKPYLFMELILKEKDFREALKGVDWEVYKGVPVAVTCTADAIIPVWAYMLVASYLEPFAIDVYLGTADEMHKQLFLAALRQIDPQQFADKRVVVKGCGETPIGDFAYLEITRLLRPVAKTIMYGEPCSTVPVYKKR